MGPLPSPSLSGNAGFSLAWYGVAIAPSVQPQCSPFLVWFKGLQIQRKSSHTRPLGSLCPAYQTKPSKQLHEKCPTAGAGQRFPSNVVIRRLGFKQSYSKFLSWSPIWIRSIEILVLPLNMQKDNKELKTDTYLSLLWTWEINIATNASQLSGVWVISGARQKDDLFCVLSQAPWRL